ncbi:hypothetical protein Q31a_12880 [Aureliella helgolandensis]|uniref:Uncharacterized protein n=1 Tax=Aureliella helgolandensis TaxID=2527968 RepID=A0A518G348_9BACT|nr:hypothetical protein Q31a_12880 [Aureliella helgolandensis]
MEQSARIAKQTRTSNSVIASNLESGATVPQGTSNRKRSPNRSPVLRADICIVPGALQAITVTVHDLPYPSSSFNRRFRFEFKSQTMVNGYLSLLLPLPIERNNIVSTTTISLSTRTVEGKTQAITEQRRSALIQSCNAAGGILLWKPSITDCCWGSPDKSVHSLGSLLRS